MREAAHADAKAHGRVRDLDHRGQAPATPHLLLPVDVAVLRILGLHELANSRIGYEAARNLLAPPGERAEKLAQASETLLERKEREAVLSQQPFGWNQRLYQSVTGLRWTCCGNLFEDDHSPWCAAGGQLDPFPVEGA